MQTAAPEVMDIARESPATLAAYGAQPGAGSFANNCLLARRMVEQGVRFVQLFDWGWDFHGTSAGIGITTGLTQALPGHVQAGRGTAQGPADARPLERDPGHLGRRIRPHAVPGRPHRAKCDPRSRSLSRLLHHVPGSGGIKPGLTYGETDELGFSIVRDKVHVHDLQATILHLLGFITSD